jgi:hypothetical protein
MGWADGGNATVNRRLLFRMGLDRAVLSNAMEGKAKVGEWVD